MGRTTIVVAHRLSTVRNADVSMGKRSAAVQAVPLGGGGARALPFAGAGGEGRCKGGGSNRCRAALQVR